MCYPPATKGMHLEAAAIQRKFCETVSCSRNNNCVAGLKLNILVRILAFDDFLIVERKPRLRSVRILAQNVNGFLLGEVSKSTGEGDRVQYCRRIADGK